MCIAYQYPNAYPSYEMPTKDLHAKPFDDATKGKLRIFQEYLRVWLPTFVMGTRKRLCIVDFFAGTGYDESRCQGSPINTLEVVKQYSEMLFKRGVRIELHLNEFNKKKYNLLKRSCTEYIQQHEQLTRLIDLNYYNLDFEVAFDQLINRIEKFPALVYLDQNGIKFLTRGRLMALEASRQTDFLYFVSSSYLKRFGQTEQFQRYLPVDTAKIKDVDYNLIHEHLLDQIKYLLPSNTALRLYPFSIKKGPNIYGIVFGAQSPRAVEKFLTLAWKENALNGSANFDIEEDDFQGSQMSLFAAPKITKLRKFEIALEKFVLTNMPVLNSTLYLWTLERGHTPSQALAVLKKMKKNNKIVYNGRSPKIKYSSLRKEADQVMITNTNTDEKEQQN